MGNKSGKRKKDPSILTQVFTFLNLVWVLFVIFFIFSNFKTKDDIETLVANTHFSPDQIRAWHVGFIKDCPKGELDKRKFTDVYKEFYPQGKADKFCAQVFSVFDADNSGKIDFTEVRKRRHIFAKGLIFWIVKKIFIRRLKILFSDEHNNRWI